MDPQQLDLIDEGISARIPPIEPLAPKFTFGTMCKDKTGPFKGRITLISYHLNGCATVALTADELSRDGKSVLESFNVNSIEVVGKSVAPTPPLEKPIGPPVVRGAMSRGQ